MLVRINKYLSDCGIASRRKVEELILQGRVMVKNHVVTSLSTKVDPENDIVKLDGENVSSQKYVYYLLNKPKGVITSTADEKGRKTVIDLIKTDKSIYPIGRLDYNTTGVLILTNDGNFSYLLTHPKHKVPREYEVKLDKHLEDEDRNNLLTGIYLDKRKSKFDSISSSKEKTAFVRVKCHEGKNHFVKRMFSSLGYNVISLNRSSFAGLKPDIPIGTYRKLSHKEINTITNQYA
jgi:23S rRNA pseudouridine2605 synthase